MGWYQGIKGSRDCLRNDLVEILDGNGRSKHISFELCYELALSCYTDYTNYMQAHFLTLGLKPATDLSSLPFGIDHAYDREWHRHAALPQHEASSSKRLAHYMS